MAEPDAREQGYLITPRLKRVVPPTRNGAERSRDRSDPTRSRSRRRRLAVDLSSARAAPRASRYRSSLRCSMAAGDKLPKASAYTSFARGQLWPANGNGRDGRVRAADGADSRGAFQLGYRLRRSGRRDTSGHPVPGAWRHLRETVGALTMPLDFARVDFLGQSRP